MMRLMTSRFEQVLHRQGEQMNMYKRMRGKWRSVPPFGAADVHRISNEVRRGQAFRIDLLGPSHRRLWGPLSLSSSVQQETPGEQTLDIARCWLTRIRARRNAQLICPPPLWKLPSAIHEAQGSVEVLRPPAQGMFEHMGK